MGILNLFYADQDMGDARESGAAVGRKVAQIEERLRVTDLIDQYPHEDHCSRADDRRYNCTCWKRSLTNAVHAAEQPVIEVTLDYRPCTHLRCLAGPRCRGAEPARKGDTIDVRWGMTRRDGAPVRARGKFMLAENPRNPTWRLYGAPLDEVWIVNGHWTAPPEYA